MKTPINALTREDHTRMLKLARDAQPTPLGFAVELALTTGMRCGEVCALRWSDLNDDGTIAVSHALGNGAGGFYVKPEDVWAKHNQTSAPTITFTEEQLIAMLEQLRSGKNGGGAACA